MLAMLVSYLVNDTWQEGKAPSWARAPIGADSHDGFCIMHNIIFSADPKRAKMASRKLFLRDS